MIQCKHCNEKINIKDKKRKFCNRSCSAKFNNKFKRKKRGKRKCENCKCVFQLTSKNFRNKNCDTCAKGNLYLIKTSLDEILDDKTRRLFLIRKFGHQCQICKNTTWNGKKIPLQLDHIDGKANNNTAENLRILCPNCHAQTPTFAGRNVGNGTRYKRNEKYQERKN